MMIDHHSPTISIHFQKFLHTSHDSNFPHRYGYLSESPNSKDSSVTWVSRIFFTLSWGPRRGFRSKMMMIRGWFLDGWNGWLEWNILDDGPRWCLAPHAYWCHISWGNSEDWNPMGYIYIYMYIYGIYLEIPSREDWRMGRKWWQLTSTGATPRNFVGFHEIVWDT